MMRCLMSRPIAVLAAAMRGGDFISLAIAKDLKRRKRKKKKGGKAMMGLLPCKAGACEVSICSLEMAVLLACGGIFAGLKDGEFLLGKDQSTNE